MAFRTLVPEIPDTQITTFTLFNYPPRHRLWAFSQMGMPAIRFRSVPGLQFSKLMGSGKHGFSLQPDFSRYALLAVWESDAAANHFFASPHVRPFREKSEMWTVKLLPLRSHGSWDQQHPFAGSNAPSFAHLPVAVLTRATIRLQALWDFWKHVPLASQMINQSPDLIFSVGVGEKPLIRQATVSFWKSAEAMETFAYRQAGHREIVKRTRDRHWYSEDLFARFVPLATEGTYRGKDILAEYTLQAQT